MKPLRHAGELATTLVMAIASMVFPLKGAQATIVVAISQMNLIRQTESFDTILDTFSVSPIAMLLNQGTWRTSLQARDRAGNGAGIDAFYDPFLNLTWLADPASNGRQDFPTRVCVGQSGDVLGPSALPAPVPLPSSPLLFGSVLAVLVGCRRRRRQADARPPATCQVNLLHIQALHHQQH